MSPAKKPMSKTWKIVIGSLLGVLLLVILISAFAPEPNMSDQPAKVDQWAQNGDFQVKAGAFDVFTNAPYTGDAGPGMTFIDVPVEYKNIGDSKSGVYGGKLIARIGDSDKEYEAVKTRGFGKSGNIEAGEIKQMGEVFKIPTEMLKAKLFYKPYTAVGSSGWIALN